MEVDGSEPANPIAVAHVEANPAPASGIPESTVRGPNASDVGSRSVEDTKPASSEVAEQKPFNGQTTMSPVGKNITHTEATLSLRDALLRKSEKARFTPPSDAELQKALGSPGSNSPLPNGVDKRTLPDSKASQVNGAMTPEKSTPREPRGKDSHAESKLQPPLRSMEPPAAPRGSMSISRQAPSASISVEEIKSSVPSDRSDYRDKSKDAQAPATPRDLREREDRHQTVPEIYPRNDHATSSFRGMTSGSSRRTSPGRLPGSRSGSVDSKYSRASDHHREQERRSDRRLGDRDRDRHPDRERERARESEKEKDGRKEKDQDKPSDRTSDRDRDHSHRSDRHRPEDNGRERRRDARERDDKREDKRRGDRDRERRDRDRDRPRDRDRGKERDEKDRSRLSRREDEREKEKEKDSAKERDKERNRERDRGERTNDKERERDDRERTRDTGRRDRDVARSRDGDRDRYQGRNRERSEKDARSRDERDTVGETDSRRSDRSAGGSSLEVRSSIDALSRRFDAQRQHSITDSRITSAESVTEVCVQSACFNVIRD